MKLIKTHWKKLIGVIAVIAVLVFAYWYGGSAPGSRGFVTTEQTEEASEEQVDEETSSVVDAEVLEEPAGSETYSSEDAEVSEDQADTETSSEDDTDVSEETTEAKASSEKAVEVTEEADGETTQSDEDTQTSKGSADAEISSTGSSSGGNGSSSDSSSSGSSGSGSSAGSSSSGSSGSGSSSGSSGSSSSGSSGSSGSSNGSSGSSNDSEAATDSAGQCTISISCATILNNMSLLDSAKTSIIPSDGCILQTVTIDIEDGDTVFDILSKATRKYGISLEYSYTAIYGSYYIEGIANIYEFDCGELSGWMYSVNGSFPSYGCSKYVVSDGDTIKWVYTCDLGADVGNPY